MGGTRMKSGPDKGWSWVVAFAACFSSLVLAGIFRTGGVLFVAFIDAFDVTREEASWPMVICISVLNLTGPLSGILGQRYGVRPVVILGAIVGAVGVSSCFFTTSLDVITVLFGGVFGLGYGLVNTLMPVIVNTYFLELRGLANGIANSGSCFGSVILPILFEFLIEHYGLSGCFLLTGGIVLNVAIAGALLRPPSWLSKNEEKSTDCTPFESSYANEVPKNVSTNNSRHHNKRRKTSTNSIDKQSADAKQKSQFDSIVEDVSLSITHQTLHAELVETLRNRTKLNDNTSHAFAGYKDPSSFSLFTTTSSLNVDRKASGSENNPELFRAQQEFQDSLNDFQSAVLSILESSQSEEVLNKLDNVDEVKTSELTDSCPARHSFSISSTQRPRGKFNKSTILSARPLKKSDLKFDSSSGDSVFLTNDKPTFQSNADVVTEHKKVSITIMDNIEEEKQTELDSCQSVVNEESHSILQPFQVVLSNSMFYVIALTNVIFYFMFHMFVVIIVDYSLDCGVPMYHTKYIIFAFSAADLIGRLCLGWITDRKYTTRSHFVMICMAAISVVFFTFPLSSSFWALIVSSCGYGVLLGCTMIVFPILLVDYLGIEVHAAAYGCLCFLNGFASLARPLIIGYFRDNIGSYSNMFYVLGIISAVASFTWLLERCFIKRTRLPQDLKITNDTSSGDKVQNGKI